jgi:uncharacterized protein (TIGR03790 family)
VPLKVASLPEHTPDTARSDVCRLRYWRFVFLVGESPPARANLEDFDALACNAEAKIQLGANVWWRPAMLLPSADESLARALIERGIQSDATRAKGKVYLIQTQDASRNVRAQFYGEAESIVAGRVIVRRLSTPVEQLDDPAIAYFTGAVRVDELKRIHFLPGAAADHLTSIGRDLEGAGQMSAIEWLRQGATASYGTVSEACNQTGKFPSPAIFLEHYLHGETVLESYRKSVAMPEQGLFIGESLARPFATGS